MGAVQLSACLARVGMQHLDTSWAAPAPLLQVLPLRRALHHEPTAQGLLPLAAAVTAADAAGGLSAAVDPARGDAGGRGEDAGRTQCEAGPDPSGPADGGPGLLAKQTNQGSRNAAGAGWEERTAGMLQELMPPGALQSPFQGQWCRCTVHLGPVSLPAAGIATGSRGSRSRLSRSCKYFLSYAMPGACRVR